MTEYRLPNGLIKVRRRWGQRHPQGANLGSNGILKLMSLNANWLPPAHPNPLPANVCQASPFRLAIRIGWTYATSYHNLEQGERKHSSSSKQQTCVLSQATKCMLEWTIY
jgi:hypothetical protein